MRFKKAFLQIWFLYKEIKIYINKRWWRWLTIWFNQGSVWVNLSYRVDRFFYLIFGKLWVILRIFLFPVFIVLKILGGRHEIHYRADIGEGLKVLHASLGVVINGHAQIGKNLVLTGGNCIGGRKSLSENSLVIGDNVSLGANAVILGPVKIGSNTIIGAGAVVVKDFEGNGVLVGVPAKPIKDNKS